VADPEFSNRGGGRRRRPRDVGSRRRRRRGGLGLERGCPPPQRGWGLPCPLPRKFFFIFYAEIMHFGAKFLLGFTMHSVNRGGAAAPLDLNSPLLLFDIYYTFFGSWTRLQASPLNWFLCLIRQITRFWARKCLFIVIKYKFYFFAYLFEKNYNGAYGKNFKIL